MPEYRTRQGFESNYLCACPNLSQKGKDFNMNILTKKVFNKICAIIVIMLLTMSDFLLVGKSMVTYALDVVQTNNPNVDFVAYFMNENEEKLERVEKDIDAEEYLYVDISVKNEGYFNGNISLKNSNFKISDEKLSQDISSISNNVVTLNQINAGTTSTIKLKIEANKEDVITKEALNRKTSVVLQGNYVNSKNVEKQKHIEISGTSNVEVDWKSSEEVSAELKSDVLTNAVYNVNGEEKRIVQILINSKLTNNNYPIKNTNINLNVIDNVEEVRVNARSTAGTNKNINFNKNNYIYDEVNKTLAIKLENENENNISWSKNAEDSIVVTYVLSKEANVQNKEITVNSTINTYDNKELKSGANVHIEKDIDGIISCDIVNSENSIYKGKIYTGEEREYTEKSKINIGYKEIVNNVTFNLNTSTYLTANSELAANIVYKEITINKEEIVKVLGEDGYIEIKDENNLVVANITKDAEVDENGNIKVTVNAKKVTITTSKPIEEGTLNIESKKAIQNSGYTREQIKELTGIKETVSVGYNGNVYSNKESKIELKETQTSAKLDVNVEKLGTIEENKNVKMTVTLPNNDESKDLYQNPTIKITLPKQVTKVTESKCKLLYGNGLQLQNAKIAKENENYVMNINLTGTQSEYSTEVIEGTTIVVYANLSLDELAGSGKENITLNYTNEIASTYVDNGVEQAQVEIEGKSGLIVTNDIADVKTVGNEGQKDVKIPILKEAKDMTVEIRAVNNEGAEIKDVKILGSFPTAGENTIGAILTSGINITESKGKVEVYYSENENATDNVEDKANGWKTEGNSNTVKKYLIKIDTIGAGEKFEANYNINIPENREFNMKATEGYEVKYINVLTNSIKQEQATQMNITTGEGTKLNITTDAYVGGEKLENGATVYDGEVIKYVTTIENTGDMVASKVDVTATIPENTTYVQYQKNVLEDTDIDDDDDEDEDETADTESDGEYQLFTDSYIDREEKILNSSIENIKVGEKRKISYEVRVNTGTAENTELKNTVNATYNEYKFPAVELKHKVKKADMQLTLTMLDRKSMQVNELESNKFLLEIKNLKGEDLKNVELDFKGNFNISDIEKVGDDTEESEIQIEEEKCIIKLLKANETVKYVINTSVEAYEYSYDEESGDDDSVIAQLVSNPKICVVANKMYHSNEVVEKLLNESINMNMTSDTEYSTLKVGDDVTYNIDIYNVGDKIENLIINQNLINAVQVKKVIIDGKEVQYAQTQVGNEVDDKKIVTFNTPLEQDAEMKIEVQCEINKEIQLKDNIKLKSIAEAETKDLAPIATTDEVYHSILSNVVYPSSDGGDSGNSDNGDDAGNQNNNGNNNNGQTSNQGANETNKYNISGNVWLDEDADGEKDADEEKISGVKVTLMDMQSNNIAEATSGSNGSYNLREIPNGEYIVMFEYDKDKYMLTTYKADGVLESRNSDAENVKMNINGEEQTVASTDSLIVNGQNISNIDLGLIEAKTFDLELSKSINKVTVINNERTETTNYDNTELAKVDIKAKELSGSTVITEYKIKVTNTGEIAGYAKNIVDYKPSDLTFNSELNPDWYKSGENLYSKGLADTKIEPGESKELTLVLTKQMTETNTGLVNNTAELQETFNSLNVEDMDSTPGNKKTGEDDMSSGNLIISVKTGGAVSFVAITLSIITVMMVGAYLVGRKLMKDNIKF